MLQNMYYDMDNSSADLSAQSLADASSNSTPFSVKDILNIGDGSDGYLNCHLER